MIVRVFLTGFLILTATLPLAAEVVQLEYCEATGPFEHSFLNCFPNRAGTAGWRNGGDFLSKRALTFSLEVPLARWLPNALAVCVDFETPESKYPGYLYVDTNGNRTIDDGEKYTLKWLEGKEHTIDGREAILPNHLIAEKIPFSIGTDDEKQTVFGNIVFSYQAFASRRDVRYCRFSAVAWGCRRGRVTLDGTTYDVILGDRNANGVFGDFARESWAGSLPSDSLVLIPEGSSATGSLPLRKQIILGGQGYSVDVSDNGGQLAIDPIEVEFGDVAASSGEIEMTLWNLHWGLTEVAPGETEKLPAGDWYVSEFTCGCPETGALCSFDGSPKSKIHVVAGKKSVVELETILNATVESDRGTGRIRLTLDLTTSQGARFRSYRGPRSADDPFRGIPFIITNSAGETVKQGYFEFG